MDISFLAKYFPPQLTDALFFLGTKDMQELRIVADKSCAVIKNGNITDTGLIISGEELKKMVEKMCGGSMYAVQETLSRGYITLPGGHRVGVCGRVSVSGGAVVQMKSIFAVCIRIAREVKGCADEIMKYILCGEKLYNTLIISPPGCGKTTVLRDIARTLGEKKRVCIADERSEIAALSQKGGADVGKYTCVMDGVPKSAGMQMLLRTMSPDVIITDESGNEEDARAILSAVNCGVKIITSAHGYSEKDVLKRTCLGTLCESGIFERIIVLSGRNGPATIEKIISDGRALCRV